MASQLSYEHFRKAHSFGLNTGISLIHYPPLDRERGEVEKMDIRAGGELNALLLELIKSEHKDWGTLTMRELIDSL
jgi:hypothetical protein